ncbi:RsmB/NOP family class I SAM-dependent RNA methyltransferase [Methylophilaceae bacterium]|nr:RsmB/NOP family class I SAM-dependent RNA methyltransferase [Methylophilaceae bacterium]
MNRLAIKACADILGESFRQNLPADVQLSYYFKNNRNLGSVDRGAIAEIYYGVIRNKRLLEEIVGDAHCKKMILVYLLVLKGHSIKELNEVTDEYEIEWLINKKKNKVHIDSWPKKLSLPDWIWTKLTLYYGEEEAIALATALLKPATLQLRVNSLKASSVKDVVDEFRLSFPAEADKIKQTEWSKQAITLPRGTPIQKHPLFLGGSIEVQEEGSQLLSLLLDAKRGHMVADFCAGAGGKALALSALMKNTGRIYAFDISDRRLANLKQRLKRSGASNIAMQRISNENDLKIKRLRNKLDRVLVDAPCTGLGTLRRNPDLKWRQTEESLSELTIKQASILEAASKLCKKGGYLVYATCSILNDENEDIVTQFLKKNKHFKIIPQHTIMQKHGVNIGDGDFLKLTTHTHKTDGFFGALMERVD